MKRVVGDLVALGRQGKFDVIVQGCNCMKTMGRGLAEQIKFAFPEACRIDMQTEFGDQSKLGTYTFANVRVQGGARLTVVNAYTQFHWQKKFSKDGVLADYEAIRSVFRKISQDFSGLRIAYPRIGAGLAGGDWQVIEKIIEEELCGMDHTLVSLE